MRKIILSVLIISMPAYAEFTRSESGIIRDNTTQLEWQDDYTGTINSKYFTVKYSSWTKALDYCASLRLGGYDNWELPNFEELSTLIDLRYKKPTINPIFKHALPTKYWSSTTHSDADEFAGGVYFYTGFQFYYDKTSNNYVRCVRRYEINKNKVN